MSKRTSMGAAAAVLSFFAGPARAQGPVLLMGIDAEEGGPGGHGPITIYESLLTNPAGNGLLDSVTNGGSGVLVIGGGKDALDDVTRFWTRIETDLGPGFVTFVNGSANISGRSFAGFAALAVVGDIIETGGGLTNAEMSALVARSADVGDFVNGGGGLLGFASARLAQPYGYLAPFGDFTFNNAGSYFDITPTPEGTAIGITNAMDIQWWHDEFLTFPAYLDVLAVNALTGRAAAIGGVATVVPPPPPPPPPTGPTSRIVWRHLGLGTNFMWLIRPDGVSGVATLPPLKDRRWRIVGTGDWNGDGFDDLAWRHLGTGRNAIWTLEEGALLESTALPRVSNPAWKIVGAGDFDANGTPDLLWRHQPSGANKLWLMDGLNVARREVLRQVSPGYAAAAVADFDGDGRADVLWRNQAAGRNLLWLMDGIEVALQVKLPSMNPNWRAAAAGDFDGDGRADILWRRQRTGQNAVWRMDGPVAVATGALPAHAWPAWTVLGVADIDGDGRNDILWRNAATGDNVAWLADGLSVAGTMWLNHIPAGDWTASIGAID
jgi:hypothetical protein